jgi:hypothetical protein
VDEPVDGFSVEKQDDQVVLTLSNRYGTVDVYHFSLDDAAEIGLAMVRFGQKA